MRLALYQPDIPQNLGAAIRLAACFGIDLDVIEPCGFPLTDPSLKRAALDYGPLAKVKRHASYAHFQAQSAQVGARLVLVETDGAAALPDFEFSTGDTLLLGRESAGSPPELYATTAASVRIPMAPGARSLNVVVAGAIVLGEAMRQTGAWRSL